MLAAWPLCLERLEAELSAEDFHTWLKPLQAAPQGESLALFAPNAFVVDTVRDRYFARIVQLLRHFSADESLVVKLEVGALTRSVPTPMATPSPAPSPGRGPASPSSTCIPSGAGRPHWPPANAC